MRQELIHPLFTHFPIVFMFMSPIFLILVALKPNNKEFLFSFRFFYYVGILFYIINIFLGDDAYELVKNSACSLMALQKHDDLAHNALYCYIFVLAFDPLSQKIPKRYSAIICLFPLVLGTYFLILTGHSGSESVYDYGTGVINKTCP